MSHLVQDFCLLGGFLLLFFFFYYYHCSISLGAISLFKFSDSSWFYLKKYMFLGIYPFCPDCPVCWPIIIQSIFLQSFVFLWFQWLFLLFHFWFYLFGSFLCCSRWVWLKICQFCLSFQTTSSWINWYFVCILILFLLFLLIPL